MPARGDKVVSSACICGEGERFGDAGIGAGLVGLDAVERFATSAQIGSELQPPVAGNGDIAYASEGHDVPPATCIWVYVGARYVCSVAVGVCSETDIEGRCCCCESKKDLRILHIEGVSSIR